jgi:hypothetical protein
MQSFLVFRFFATAFDVHVSFFFDSKTLTDLSKCLNVITLLSTQPNPHDIKQSIVTLIGAAKCIKFDLANHLCSV